MSALFLWAHQSTAQIKNPWISSGQLIKNIPSLKKFTPGRNFKLIQSRDENGLLILKGNKKNIPIQIYDKSPLQKDPVAQSNDTTHPNGIQTLLTPEVDKNFDGASLTSGPQFAPGDPDLAVGPNHIIQMINGSSGALFQVFDKTGNTIINRTYMATLLAAPGYTGTGDGIVLYDQLADRYVMTEFGRSNASNFINTLIIAVSQTNNPVNGWNLYKFTDTLFLDYPKYAVWTDAYYATTNDFTRTAPYNYLSSTLWAFERDAMLAGAPLVRVQKFRLKDDFGGRYYSMAPISLVGNALPPPNTPGMIAFLHDDAWTLEPNDSDSIGIISFKVDFDDPSNSQYTIKTLPASPYKTFVGNAPTPGANTVGVVNFRLMNRITYRNFGTHQSILGSQTVDAGSNVAGIRWSELRKTSTEWSIYQEGTYGGMGIRRRFIGSIAMNSSGQIAMAYNISSTSDWPSLAFTGRNVNEPLGEMTYVEKDIYSGNGYGTLGSRWGDYNSLVEDPANDSIFWFTAMYGSTRWKTRIASLKLPPHENFNVKLLSIDNPVNGSVECISGVMPSITFRNAGNIPLTSLTINTQIDNGPVAITNWIGSLLFAQTQTFILPSVSASPGNHTMTIYSSAPNGQIDEYPMNDTSKVTFTIGASFMLPLTQNFEDSIFPPPGWKMINPNTGSKFWNRKLNVGNSGIGSAFMDLYNYPAIDELDYLVSPVVDITNADSVIIDFNRAYKRNYNSNNKYDTLMIQMSFDCGKTFPVTVWKKGGTELATVPYTLGSGSWNPGNDEWKKELLDIYPFSAGSNNISLAFVSKNRNGQNIFIDDINIRKVVYPVRDVILKNISNLTRVCTGSTIPIVEIANLGKDTLRNVKVLFRVNNNPLDSVIWTGVLASRQTTTISLKNVILAASGNYMLTVFTKEPNGLNDFNTLNDSLRMTFNVFNEQASPVKEGFEQVSFLSNWGVEASNGTYTWERNIRAASENIGSLWIRNYRFKSNDKGDDLFSPIVQTNLADSVLLKFDISHITNLPEMDTLEVMLTTDCGNTYIPVYKKWGSELETIKDPFFPRSFSVTDTIGFVPTSLTHWRNERVDITKWVNNSKFQVVFRNKSNHGNNTFLDNINISTVTLPSKLKEKGHIITPNPFDGAFVVQHIAPPLNLKAIIIINPAGQKIFDRTFRGDAPNYINMDLSSYPAGVYVVKMVYSNKIITERIIKRK